MNAIEVFRQDFPKDLLKLIAGGMIDSYRQADDALGSMIRDGRVRGNTYPWMRRGLIEDMLLETCGDYGDPVVVSQAGGEFFWFHVEIRVGRVVLTQSAALDADAPLRAATYKKTLAVGSQRLLFPDSHDIQDEACLYASLLHNKLPQDVSQMGFAQIRFPRVNHLGLLDGFHDGHIDLMDEFIELFTIAPSEGVISSEEIIEDTAIPQPLNIRKAE
jgi:hypothetical protein